MLYYKKTDGKKVKYDAQETYTITIEDGKYLFRRFINGNIDESYASVNKEKASIYAVAIIQGFQPPRFLCHQDKPVGRIPSELV